MNAETFLNGRVTLHAGDCLDRIKDIADASIDSVCTDPPYGLAFMAKHWDSACAKQVAFNPEFWAEVYRVLKPGGHVLAFGGTRTVHRLTCAIEDAGFEIRDMVAWLYGSGFPKSHDVSKGIDRAAGAKRQVVGANANYRSVSSVSYSGVYAGGNTGASEITASATDAARQWEGWGTALKPALEPITFARKPLAGTVAENVLTHGTGALNIAACRIGTDARSYAPKGTSANAGMIRVPEHRAGIAGELTVVNGRWPANLIHDGSEEAVAAFPVLGKSTGGRIGNAGGGDVQNLPTGQHSKGDPGFGDSGSAARFFYNAKADSDDRIGSKHPTVKPVDLMRYLVRLVTPPGGTVLDPFAGTGTTGEAAFYEGFRAVLIEREDEYRADIARRMALVMAGPDERKRAIVKAKSLGKAEDLTGTLFGFAPMAAE